MQLASVRYITMNTAKTSPRGAGITFRYVIRRMRRIGSKELPFSCQRAAWEGC